MNASVTYLLPDKLGGVFNYTENLLAHRVSDGFSYYAVLTDNLVDDDPRSDRTLSAHTVTHFQYSLPPENIRSVLKRLVRAIPYGPGVLVINDWLPLAMASVHDTGKMIVNITHADSDYYYNLVERHEPIIDCFVTYTEQMHTRLRRLLPRRWDSIFLLPYGVTISGAPRTPQPGPLRLLYVGRFTREKGIFDLVRIDAALQRRNIPVVWTVHGTGPEELEFKAEWENEEVRWSGRQSHDRVLQLYRTHDVLVMPSRSEGLPVALLEATSAGVIPVVSDLASGIPDVVEPGVTGYRIRPGDIEGFANAITELAADRDRMEIMSSNVRKKVRSRFDIRTLAPGYQALYARWKELKRPRPRHFPLQYGSSLDKPWFPNALVRTLRRHRVPPRHQ
jgi:glycosyltransferase involved in cell wall biosynthesis